MCPKDSKKEFFMRTKFSRRNFLKGLAAGAAGVALSTGAHAARKEAHKLNFVFFLIDDMGWVDLSCYGSKYYETPNIDRLASQGMRFTQAYAACPVCSPTRASIMTGKYPARLHLTDFIPGHVHPYAKLAVPDWTKYLPLEEVTIAEAFKDAGYTTCFIGKWHLGSGKYYPEKQGFDINIAGCSRGAPSTYFSPYNIENLTNGPEGEYLTDRLTDEAVRFLDENGDKPFLLYFSHYAVHTPLQAKKEVIEKYERKPKHGQKSAVYAAMVESVDDSVGRIMEKLEELGIADDTAIIFMSDNGGHVGATNNAPLREAKGTGYEGGIRVPMIVKCTGIVEPNSVCDVPVISNDFYPTMLEMAGLPLRPEQHCDGVSLMPLLTKKGEIEREALFWHYPHYHRSEPFGAVRKGDWKLIEYYEDMAVELYNLKDDIGEQNDLAEKNPAKVEELRELLNKWRESVGAQMPTPNPNFDPERADRLPKGGRIRAVRPWRR